MRLASLHLQNFRNFADWRMTEIAPLVALAGPNGAGKTNILEAISLLGPGKGLRGATLPALMKQDADNAVGWGVHAMLDNGLNVSTGWQNSMARRHITIGADATATQKDLAEAVAVHWLTPAMDRMVAEAPAGRRKFIDRLVFALDPAHAGRVTRYEKSVSERLRILRESGPNAQRDWLQGLELDAAGTGASIAAARVSWLRRITPYLSLHASESFPQPAIALHGFMETGMESNIPSVALEKQMAEGLMRARQIDADGGTSSVGPHRTDIAIAYAQKNHDARLASTGEQKALLITLMLAQTHMLHDERGMKPILLLDDIASHLDESRRAVLLQTLTDYADHGGQVFITMAEHVPGWDIPYARVTS